MCEDTCTFRQFLISEMNINYNKVESIDPNNRDNNSTNNCEAIIVRFLQFNDRQLLWGDRMTPARKKYSSCSANINHISHNINMCIIHNVNNEYMKIYNMAFDLQFDFK